MHHNPTIAPLLILCALLVGCGDSTEVEGESEVATSNGTTSSNGTSTSSTTTTTGTSTGTTYTETTPGCDGQPGECGSCDSDVSFPTECVDGTWLCVQGEPLPLDCTYPLCTDYDRNDVCCDADGVATTAECFSPSQPICPADQELSDAFCGELSEFGCNTHQDCERGGCFAPYEPIGCGACLDLPGCDSDEECAVMGEGVICDTPTISDCHCGSAQTICRQGCLADENCGPGQLCTEDHRCVVLECEEVADCPEFFDCRDGVCGRRGCVNDVPCGAGHCVKGACYEVLGFCTDPPP